MRQRCLQSTLAFSLTFLVLTLAGGTPARASSATFDQIIAASPAEYAGYQVKLTYTGPQSKTTPTLLLAGLGRVAAVNEFLSYRSAGIHYGNDDIAVVILPVSASTIQRFVEGLRDRPELTVSGGHASPFLSIMIERGTPPSELVFEHLADELEADHTLNVLIGASRPESESLKAMIRRFRNFTVGPH